jgi:hypothetical protein
LTKTSYEKKEVKETKPKRMLRILMPLGRQQNSKVRTNLGGKLDET